MSEEQQKAIIDRFVQKAISRKFLVWLSCTGLLAFGAGLTSSDYVTICAIYVGGQSVIDAVAKLRGIR